MSFDTLVAPAVVLVAAAAPGLVAYAQAPIRIGASLSLTGRRSSRG